MRKLEVELRFLWTQSWLEWPSTLDDITSHPTALLMYVAIPSPGYVFAHARQKIKTSSYIRFRSIRLGPIDWRSRRDNVLRYDCSHTSLLLSHATAAYRQLLFSRFDC
jgi:hypothetical protein